MVDFIRFLVKENPYKPIDSDLYFGISEKDGDNSDNGHWLLDLKTGKWKHTKSKLFED